MSDDYRFIKKMVAMELEHILKCNEINKLIEEEKKYKKNIRKMKVYKEMEQRSPEWFKLRLGTITGTRLKEVFKSKLRFSF